MPALSALDELHQIIGIFAVLVCVLTVAAVGTRPWRFASLVLFLDTFALVAFALISDDINRVSFTHFKSVAVATLYGWLVLRNRDLGLVVLASLQFLAVFVHLSVWLDRSILASINGLVLNCIGWAMMLVLLLGGVVSRYVQLQKDGGQTAIRAED